MALGTPPSTRSDSAHSIRDLLSEGGTAPILSSSCLRAPPEAESGLWKAIRKLESLSPTFVSVTYGAGGSTRGGRTIKVTAVSRRRRPSPPVAHLTAVDHSVAELRNILGHYADQGVRNILALRGDRPAILSAPGRDTPRA